MARFDQRGSIHQQPSSASATTTSFNNNDATNGVGVGVIPSFPPDNDLYLCNESEGTADYSSSSSSSIDKSLYINSAILVPRGLCSFEYKALSAQRLGASAIIIYGSLSSRYGLNYTNSTTTTNEEGGGENNDETTNNDAKTRDDYTINDMIWPGDKYDYDCTFGQAHIPSEEFSNLLSFGQLPGGYDGMTNDGYLTGLGSENLCVKYDTNVASSSSSSSFGNKCESQRCLVTGRNVTTTTNDDGSSSSSGSSSTTTYYEACCAWDLHVWLYADTSIPKTVEEVTIPAVYVTMQESAEIMDLIRGSSSSSGEGGDPILLSIYQRYRPQYNASAVLIWAFGVFVAWISSYMSSSEIRRVSKAIEMQRVLKSRMDSMESNVERQRHNSNGRRASSLEVEEPSSSSSNGNAEERTIYQSDNSSSASTAAIAAIAIEQSGGVRQQEESLELTAAHAAGFLVMASTSLLILFFFKIYNVVKIMYAFGCSGAFAQIIVHPGFTTLCRKLRWNGPMQHVSWLSEAAVTRETLRGGMKGHCLGCLWSVFGPTSFVDIASVVISYGVGAIWLWVAFTIPHPDTVAFYWIVQNIFGTCMCMLFLETIKLNAIKVGAVLLIVAFFYDIFFVFITPLLTKHGESIMVNVATSGGPPKADPSWCEKYPFSEDCKGGDPLPMLFAIPRIGDYQGGCSMLGLGDIVLPGLLLSFASRYDESKRLMGLISGGSGRGRNNACVDATSPPNKSFFLCCCCCRNGYFGPVIVAYAIGLLMANTAVYIMEMGQPALLYLVPCCLGTMVYMGHKAGELKDMWDGPRVIRAADEIMYGTSQVESAMADNGEDERRALDGRRNNVEEAEMT